MKQQVRRHTRAYSQDAPPRNGKSVARPAVLQHITEYYDSVGGVPPCHRVRYNECRSGGRPWPQRTFEPEASPVGQGTWRTYGPDAEMLLTRAKAEVVEDADGGRGIHRPEETTGTQGTRQQNPASP